MVLISLAGPRSCSRLKSLDLVRCRRRSADRTIAPFWGVRQFDLVQVHNLVTWEAQLQTLFEMKASGQIRYVGITAVRRAIQHSQESLRALAKRYGINQKTVAT
ncbi:MAG: hypothetical protein ABS59_03760 [Methylobacterium sp. SCN 67-24]|nr:MAG: hypothetical protein ABS59_03760 [Methylobacterium sp. SCN 67-24]